MATVIKAIYHDGVLEPLEPVDLNENEQVEVVIARRCTEGHHAPHRIHSLRGIWRHLPLLGEDEVDLALCDIRVQTNHKLDRLSRELDKEFGDEPPDAPGAPA